MSDRLVTVRHPRFKDVERSVPAADVQRWVAAGWLAPEPTRRRKATRSK